MTTAPRLPAPTVTTASSADIAVLARILADAFFDDPVGQWLAPDPATRTALLARFFELEAGSFTVPHGGVLRAGDVGAALWLPPGRWRIPPLLLVRSLPRIGRIFGRRTALLLRGLSLVEHEHPREPHWYLAFLGVVVAQQGRGIGSTLLGAVLERCDDERLPAYLEATCDANRRLYERHGFAVRKELELPEGPPLWAMWREPRQARP